MIKNMHAVKLSHDAILFAEETGSDPSADVQRLIDRGEFNSWLLNELLDGADADRLDGIHEYYHAVAARADELREEEQLSQMEIYDR
jgi:hypothetical protein